MSERWGEIDDMELRQMEAEMAGELADFRAAASIYAERSRERSGQVQAAATKRGSAWFQWAGAGIAAALLIVGGLHAVHHGDTAGAGHSTTAAVQPRQADAVSDEALLNQIQSDLSTGVPAAMQPLAAGSGQGSSASERRSE